MIDDRLLDAYWKVYAEQRNHIRHHESQRSIVASSIVAIAGGCIAIITFDKSLTLSDVPLSLMVFVLGLFGLLFASKQWERSMNARSVASVCIEQIDELFPGHPLAYVFAEGTNRHMGQYGFLLRISIRVFWQLLYLFISIIGLCLMGIELLPPLLQWAGLVHG